MSLVETLPVEDYPSLTEHVKGHLDGSFDGGSDFEFCLDLILDGFERLLG